MTDNKLSELDFLAMFLHQLDSDETVPIWLCLRQDIRERRLLEAKELYHEWVKAELEAEKGRMAR